MLPNNNKNNSCLLFSQLLFLLFNRQHPVKLSCRCILDIPDTLQWATIPYLQITFHEGYLGYAGPSAENNPILAVAIIS